jgi:large subunit ribosomal protein L28
MSKRCQLCGRGSKGGHRRSHSNVKTKRRFHINLQWRRLALRPGKEPIRMRACTRCLKTRAKRLQAT